jgi:glycosyltransferase involved in cell wall biosynthesis
MVDRDLISIGEDHFAAGRLAEAEKTFRTALQSDSDNVEALNNLGVVLLHQDNATEALECFTRALSINPTHREALLNFADLSRAAGQTDLAYAGLSSYLSEYPDDQEVRSLLDQLKGEPPARLKIAVLCLPGLESFLSDIVTHLQSQHDVRTCYCVDQNQVAETVRWADTVWLEWANELAAAVTNQDNMLDGKRVICRLHSYEAFSAFPRQIDWSRIDDLVFVAHHIKNFTLDQYPGVAKAVQRMHVLPNGVDVDKYRFIPKHRGKNLAFLGNVNYKKGPLLLLHALHALVKRDPGYKLFVAGTFQDARYALYYRQMVVKLGIGKNLVVDGWVTDVPKWLENKHYIVCSSVLEGHPVGIMEAMATGLKPVIHNFVGAEQIYRPRFLWNSVDQFVEHVLENSYRPEEYRRYVTDNFSLTAQLAQLDKIIAAAEPKSESSRVAAGLGGAS